MNIRYETQLTNELRPEAILELFQEAGISKPNWTVERMQRALNGSSVIVTAWTDDQLVGFANAISDFAWIGYLSQLAVSPRYQGKGIGKHLIELIRERLGDEVTLIVHSSDRSTEFYSRMGFEPYSNVFRLRRLK